MRGWLVVLAACAPAFADQPRQDEILAAIQKAMNELGPASQQCWAAAATERYDVAGELKVRIELGDAQVHVGIVADTTRSDTLATCMTKLLLGYAWAPPLHDQDFELPFEFKAPDGQSVIDRRLVASRAQAGVSVGVLLDEANTGNAAASMLEVAIAPGKTTSGYVIDRGELWFFPDEAGMTWFPAGSRREVRANRVRRRAVVVVVPGGKEGVARAGALPGGRTPDAHTSPSSLAARDAKTYGPATIYLDPSIVKGAPLSASILQLPAGANVPEHVHAHETELLYVLSGAGLLTIAGNRLPITATSVVQIPPNTKHAFAVTEAVRALQIYTPAGPEQRFEHR
ncbi:MAG TPA: cupin domain-containing protein [Kofleriaceae bacterium]|jgi:quercetin dioxygenase-like cupin family protein